VSVVTTEQELEDSHEERHTTFLYELGRLSFV
jgi:hypothetical protein